MQKMENASVPGNDGFGMHWIVLNASGDGKATDALTDKLEKLSEIVNTDPSVLKEIMTQEEIIRNAKMDVREELQSYLEKRN